jgi:hypothetical protein
MSNQLNRLVRIMGTFDLATGHADSMDEALDALETELRDLLGHYREALKQNQSEPVAWMDRDGDIYKELPNEYWNPPHTPIYTKREWVGLTDDEVNEIYTSVEVEVNEHWNKGGTTMMFPLMLYKAIESKLKDKNV